MKSIYTIALAALVFLVFGVGSAGAQQMKEKTVKEQLVGTWRVLSAVSEIHGRKTELFGPTPKGQYIFTSEGYFSINIIRSGRTKFASDNRTTGRAEENKEAVVGSISTFGNYTLNSDGSINLQIVGSSFRRCGARRGHVRRRSSADFSNCFEISGRETTPRLRPSSRAHSAPAKFVAGSSGNLSITFLILRFGTSRSSAGER